MSNATQHPDARETAMMSLAALIQATGLTVSDYAVRVAGCRASALADLGLSGGGATPVVWTRFSSANDARMRTAAIAHELESQTPPLGGTLPFYFCPACGEDRATRGEMRAHLTSCTAYRAFLDGCVRRADLLPTAEDR